MYSVILLAGGQSRRMGQDKALLEWHGRPLIAALVERLRQVSDDVILVAPRLERLLGFAARLLPDPTPPVGPLGGLWAGLLSARYEWAFVLACDMPLVDPLIIRWLFERRSGSDAVVPVNAEGRPEPLHAFYRASCLNPIAAALARGQRAVVAFYPAIRVRYIPPADWQAVDPEGWSWRNINTPEDWAQLQREWGSAAACRHCA
ncbi:MAG: molybdenum cofactor guanylyltransferase [Thermoflexus sp.]|jgi:molybdopterin-guanine dinucleotide biosynthesis protein A|nr:molybdenum cofactor guanylyltransferase [Thermoflexus sp.]